MATEDLVKKTTLSIRELTRNGSKLNDYDYIEIQDRKSHISKGIFIPDSYAKEVVSYLTEKINRERKNKKKNLLAYAGIATGDYGEESYTDLIAEKSGKYDD